MRYSTTFTAGTFYSPVDASPEKYRIIQAILAQMSIQSGLYTNEGSYDEFSSYNLLCTLINIKLGPAPLGNGSRNSILRAREDNTDCEYLQLTADDEDGMCQLTREYPSQPYPTCWRGSYSRRTVDLTDRLGSTPVHDAATI